MPIDEITDAQRARLALHGYKIVHEEITHRWYLRRIQEPKDLIMLYCPMPRVLFRTEHELYGAYLASYSRGYLK